MCTTSEGTVYVHTNRSLDEIQIKGQQSGIPTAVAGYSTDMRMYKTYDFRCLKPKDGVPIENWPHYEMHGFRAAKTEEELKEVVEIPFDKYFFNFEDPEVLNDLTDGSDKGLELWKKSYGFDWAAWTLGHGANESLTKTREHCLKAEYGNYAQDCKTHGGFFKCCAKVFRLDVYHMIRYVLKEKKMIKDGPNKLYCGKYDGQGFCYIGLGKMHLMIFKIKN